MFKEPHQKWGKNLKNIIEWYMVMVFICIYGNGNCIYLQKRVYDGNGIYLQKRVYDASNVFANQQSMTKTKQKFNLRNPRTKMKQDNTF